ncbi:MAG: anti-sigma factor family protein [Acidimicrobiia bacterium]
MHLGDLISAYVDSQLDASERAAADEHLAGCQQCRRELDVVTSSRYRLRRLPVLEPPPEALRPPAPVVPLRPARRRLLVAAAAMSTLVVGVGFSVNAEKAVPLPLDAVVDQHVARASVDPGLNVLQVQAVVNR